MSWKTTGRKAVLLLLAPLLAIAITAEPSHSQLIVKYYVPYHSQIPCNDPVAGGWRYPEPGNNAIPNGYCTCACLEMLFDYWANDNIQHGTCNPWNPVPAPQREIAAVANTNDAMNVTGGHRGTYLDDALRAVHFSPTTPAWPSNPPAYVNQNLTGYSWTQVIALPGPAARYGMIGIEGDWVTNGWDRDDFKTMLVNHIPIMINVDADAVGDNAPIKDEEDSDAEISGYMEVEDTAVGHSILVYGFNDSLDWFYYHDPTRGACLREDQDTVWVDWWRGKDFLVMFPWNTLLSLTSPQFGLCTAFDVDMSADYTDLLPDVGTGPQVNPTKGNLGFYAINSSHLVAALAQGQNATQTYSDVQSGGDSEWMTWKCVTKKWGTDNTWAIGHTWGRVSETSTSFPGGYIDDIGSLGGRTGVDVPGLGSGDASMGHLPREGWWHATHITSTPHDYSPGVPNDITAEVTNLGSLPVTDVYVDFFYGDPGLSQYYGDPDMQPFGTDIIPLINPGETVQTSPVPFTAMDLNSFGEPYFDIFAGLHCVGDYPDDIWVEYDNNLSCQSVHHAQIDPMTGTMLEYWTKNPHAETRTVVTRMETYLPVDWATHIVPAGMDSIEMGPMDALSRSLVVEAGSEGIGMVDLCEDVYSTDGEFLLRTGGLSFLVWTTGSADVPDGETAPAVALSPPVPNPSSGEVALTFTLPEPALVDLSIFDVAGRHVACVHRGLAGARTTRLVWDGRDSNGERVASGVYFARLAAGSQARAQKIVLMR